jgi:hypothetical protein
MDLRKFLLFFLLSNPCFAADKPSADILGRWVGGKWPLTGELLDTPFGKAAKITGMSRCAWSPDHVFVVCDQELHVGAKSERELSIYAFDDKAGKFHFYSLTPASDHASNGSLEISDDGMRWIYFGTDEIGGKTVQFRTTNEYHGTDQVDWWSEASTDNGKTWIKTAFGKETREQ